MIPVLLTRLNYKIVCGISVVVLLFGIVFGFMMMPKMIMGQVVQATLILPGMENRKMWVTPPIALTFKVYMLNCTNPSEVMNGGKPNLQEVGPFVFDEFREKFNDIDDEADDTVEYELKNTFFYRPDLSNGLTGDEIVTVPHPLLFTALMPLHRDKNPMLGLAANALLLIFPEQSAFMTASVMDILFHGVGINCDQTDFAATMLCSKLGEDPTKIHVVNDTYYKFSVFGTSNGTSKGKFKAYRGKNNIQDIGKLLEFNGETELDTWEREECNKIKGTDGTAFPPFNPTNSGFWSLSVDFCRSLSTHFVKTAEYDGIPVSIISTKFGENEPGEKCFCRKPDACPPKGTIDLSVCKEGAPIIVSKPHFYEADPKLLAGVTGLKPDANLHEIEIYFEMYLGRPVQVKNRAQTSLDIEPIPEFEPMAKLPKVILPILWLEEGIALNSTFTGMIKGGLLFAMKLNSGIKWVCTLIGLAGTGFSVYMLFFFKNTNKITEVTRIDVPEKDSRSSTANSEKFKY